MTRREKEMRMIEMKTGELCEELLEDILYRVPFKPLITMKCVSKDWCSLISKFQTSLLQVSVSGLILFQSYYDLKWFGDYGHHKTLIKLFELKPDNERELDYLEYNPLCYILHGDIACLTCSNGLLLCCHQQDSVMCEPFLYNLVFKQPISLPELHNLVPQGCTVVMGLAFDGFPNQNFNVVCFFFKGDVKILDCVIFSSETGEWRKHRPQLLNSSTMDNAFVEDVNSRNTLFPCKCLFNQGSVYWTVHGYLVIYNLREDFFEIQDLPRKDLETPTDCLDECLWMSEGCLHYCYSDKDGFYVWACDMGKEIDYKGEYYDEDGEKIEVFYNVEEEEEDRWKLKHRADLETLVAQQPEFFSKSQENYSFSFLQPCAFNEDFQILYLKLPGSVVVSYSFETGCLRKVKELRSL
ncbi:hypothetical protein AQUCO_00400702v1 [Aquilegia coerulea]|uniref:Uncharacterized protein n=1 Tax=Aquilegia coerulea TaxID=218851 RepID=A0A2G5EW59_AQUCA|nr:hypothetical protein AQUCO_00400702v1 [Aquilegia coerulea]